MNEIEFQNRLSALVGQIDTLPETERAALTKLVAETKCRHETVKKTVSELQDSIDQLRLSTKYLVFDLEATRRENAQLRKLIEERTLGGDESDND